MGKGSRRRSSTSARRVDKEDLSITGEVEYIVRRAAAGDGRIVTLGSLVFFSTETGDAWMLDPEDSLALRLARDGEALDVNITETEDQFAVEWTHSFGIEGDFMTIVDRSGRCLTISGYPTGDIRRALRRMPPAEP